MARPDVIGQWAGSVQFTVISTARSLVLGSYLKDGAANRVIPWDYVEVDNRGNKGATIYWSVNGQTASSAVQSTFFTSGNALLTVGADGRSPNFRIPPDAIDRIFIRATSISVVSAGNATTIYINVARF